MTPSMNVLVRAAILGFALFGSMLHAVPPGGPGSVSMKPDQVNTAGWDKGWTNVVNDVQQGFQPSQPKLVAVEVELVVGNPDTGSDELTLTLLDKSGESVASVTQTVFESECAQTIFLMPEGGIDVVPGDSYRIRLSGGNTFGWKYVVGGYTKGGASFNGKRLLKTAKSSFLFRTFAPE